MSVLSHCFWVRGTRPSYFTSHETDTAGPLCPRWVEKDSAVQKEIIGLLQNRLPLQLYTYCVISCFRIWHKPNIFCIKGSDTCAQDHCWNLLSWMSTEYLPEELIVLKHSIHTSFTHKTLTRVNVSIVCCITSGLCACESALCSYLFLHSDNAWPLYTLR